MAHKKTRLGVNIDHVATLRNARNGSYPDILKIAKLLKKININSITVHLREDRRHIRDEDLFNLREKNYLPLNLEMAATEEMKSICLKVSPFACCIVPEKRQELTTEGGLDVIKNSKKLQRLIDSLRKKKIRVSLFVDPCENQITESKNIGANAIEIHTGRYADIFDSKGDFKVELNKIKLAAKLAVQLGLECHAGHGLNYHNVINIKNISEIEELNIGHFIISQSIFEGIGITVKKFKKILSK